MVSPLMKRVLGWTVVGWIVAEIVYLVLKSSLAPTPILSAGTAGVILFKARIALTFLLAPLMMNLLARALRDRKLMTWPRFLVVGAFMLAGLAAHLVIIKDIFGKPRPAILPPYELFTNSFYFFRWGFCGLLLGLGLISLYSLFVNKGLEDGGAAAA